MPFYFGVMGLIENGKSVFKNNLKTVAVLSGYSTKEIKENPRINILAFAKAFSVTLHQNEFDANSSKDIYIQTLEKLSELPDNNASDLYVRDIQLYGILSFLNNKEFQSFYHTQKFNYDLKSVFGKENYNVLSATQVDLKTNQIKSNSGYIYQPNSTNRITAPCAMPAGPADYPTAIWDPAASTNYGGSITPDMIAIHTMQGSYAGSIGWFKNTSASVSAQYCVRSYDGQVTQMVCNKRKAYHVGNSNALSVGIEQEAYEEEGLSWFTNAMYTSVANLINFISTSENVQKLKMYQGPPVSGLLPLSNTCYKIKGHQNYPSNTHVDPGPYFDWERLYRMVNPLPALSFSSTALSGTFYDAGGAAGNYADAAHNTFLIDPVTTNPIRVTFSSWNVEATNDYLFIYDGTDNNGRLIGKYSSNPGTITAYSGAVFFEFRSDCSTNYSGWVANWTTDASAPSCQAPVNLSATAQALTANLSWNTVAGASSYDIRYKTTIESSWTNKTTTSVSFLATGLEANAIYQWEVRSRCGTDSSGWVGGYFNTDKPGNTLQGTAAYSATSCSGDFRDSGGKLGGYTNREDWTYTIQPAGATSVTLNFSSFETETTNDILRVYNGASTSSPLIGTYSGTTSPGTIISTGGAITFRFTSSSWTVKNGWDATWSCTGGASVTNPITELQNLQEWYTGNFTLQFKDSVTCASGLKSRFYNIANYNGSAYRSNNSNGFFYDDFSNTSIHSDWTTNTGTWSINSNTLYQSDQVLTNTNIYAPLTQTNQSYLYHFKMKLNGSGTNKRAGLHFFCDNPTQSNRGNSYMVYFRDDNNTVQIYKCTANVISAPLTSDAATIPTNTWFDVKITYDATTGIIVVYKDDVQVSTYTDAAPFTSGSYISFRSAECEAYYDNFIVYKSRTSSPAVSAGFASTNDVHIENINPTTEAVEINAVILDNCSKWSALETGLTNIDFTAPKDTFHVNDGIAADIEISSESTNFYANWTPSSDTNSAVINYFYQIGTTPGGNNLVALTDNGTSTFIALTGLSLVNGTTYYITVIAKNGAGLLSNPVTSDGVLINSACAALPSTSINISPQYNNWVTNDFTASYSDATGCSCPLKYSFYNVSDYNGTEWRSNNTKGFFTDNFDNGVINPAWSLPAGYGTWSNVVGQLIQTDETLSNTNIYAAVTQIAAEVYLYEWTAVLDGVGGNRRAGLHFMCDNPTWPNRGNSYFVWFRADQDNMQIYKTSGATSATNVFGSVLYQVPLDVQVGVPYNYKVIYNPATGTITVFRDDIYIGQWTDPSPLTTGNSISCRTGNSKIAYDDIRVYKKRNTTTLVDVGNSGELRYTNPDSSTAAGNIRTILLDTCKHFSTPAEKDINIDTTMPAIITPVNDGTGADEDITNGATTLFGNWPASTDVNSTIIYYEYAIGTRVGDSNIVNWTNTGLNTSFTASGLSLLNDTIYYITVRARNGAGLYSVVSVSDGIKAALLLPVELVSLNGKYSENKIELKWVTVSETNTKEFIIERSNNGINFSEIGTIDATGFSNNVINYDYNDNTILPNQPVYYYHLKIVDLDGSYSYSSIVVISIHPVTVNSIRYYPNPFTDNLSIQFQLTASKNISIHLTDYSGKEILTKKYTANEGTSVIQLNELSALSNGIYFIQVYDNENGVVLSTEKVIKQ
ncbi:unnamed protein product [Rotaria sp. Silwood2]|nr:unnamed protein product [Rotaria sp. Silwood2]CAF4090488.1 unnamed protein product [Rotaria sp. Silwood2]